MKKTEKKEKRDNYLNELVNNCMPFWSKNGPDKVNGAFFNYLDKKGNVYCKDKPVWVIGRFGWLNSLLFNEIDSNEKWLEAAKSCIQFLEKYCFDDDGRMFFEVTADGKPLRKRRYLFTETFAVIAFAEYSKAVDDSKRIQKAVELFKLILHYYNHPDLLEPKYNPDTFQAKSHAMPMILIATAQQLRKVWNNPLCSEVIDASINEIFNDFMDYEQKALLETVGLNGERLDGPTGRCINPGHAIETSWFIMEEYLHRNAVDKQMLENALLILNWSLKRGWDEKYGGILYFVDFEDKPCVQYEHDMKLWWPHTESLYATLLAYNLTGEDIYLKWYQKIYEWTYSHFPDKEDGEWYKYLHRDGSISTTLKGNGWAGPFHYPRMLFKCSKLLSKMID